MSNDQPELVDRISDWIITCQRDGTIEQLNRAARLGFGGDPASSLNLFDIVLPEHQERLRGLIASDCPRPCDLTFFSPAGQRIDLECSLVDWPDQRCVRVVARDLTAERRLEEQLRRTQKREAIGILAGGIAHDFNNLLTGILGYADLLKLEAKPGEHLHESLTVIQRAAEQAVQLTTHLLHYARRGKEEYTRTDAHSIIREVTALLRREIDQSITVKTCLSATDCIVIGDSGQLHQVLLNLALNAAEAMPQGGHLVFHTELREPTLDLPLDSVPHLIIEVTDTGTGVAPELRERIFEPFFTTKDPGHGGMGLAVVNGIIRNHGGVVRMQSTMGEGTTFTLYLPLAGSSRSVSASPSAKERGTVLLVDEEEPARQTGIRMLEDLGYRVIALRDGAEAVRYFAQHKREIDLILLDARLPCLNGRDCCMALRLISPDVPVILTSPPGQESAVQETLGLGVAGILQKPYQISTLATVMGRALRQTEPVTGV